jgi:hypothetical protein
MLIELLSNKEIISIIILNPENDNTKENEKLEIILLLLIKKLEEFRK